MAVQFPARTLTMRRLADIPSGATCLVAVDALALRRAMLQRPGATVRSIVTEAVRAHYGRTVRKRKGK